MSDYNEDEPVYNVRDLQGGIPPALVNQIQPFSKVNFSFYKGTVKEVISKPIEWLSTKHSAESNDTNKDVYIKNKNLIDYFTDIQDSYLLEYAPLNTILVYCNEVIGEKTNSDQAIIAFPFFQSHMSLPIKAGETVWILKDDNTSGGFYYYMGRVHGIRQVEDVNFTFFERSESAITYRNLINRSRPGDANNIKSLAHSSINNVKSNGMPSKLTTEKILASSFSYLNEFTPEPVPGIKKDCCDLLLQGSNNTGLLMGTESFLTDSDFKDKKSIGLSIENNSPNIKRKPLAGSIDLFCGHSKDFINSIKRRNTKDKTLIASNPNITSLDYLEVNKLDDVEIYNNNPRNVSSRVYMSMDCSIDSVFKFYDEFEKFRGASLACYTDHLRLYSESTLRMSNIGSNNPNIIQIDQLGNITLQAGSGNNASKIILKSDGNIIIKPGANGYLSLGGDPDVDEMVAACGIPVKNKNNGLISCDPIKTSLGGELFRSGVDSHDTIDVRQTINAVAAAMAPATSVVPASLSVITAGQNLPNIPGAPAPDGSSSSKVLIVK